MCIAADHDSDWELACFLPDMHDHMYTDDHVIVYGDQSCSFC